MKNLFIFIGLIIISLVVFLRFQEPQDQTIVMPEFSLENIKGEMISIEEYKGKKTLINFWATWCRPCRKEMPMLNGVYLSEDPSEFSVVGVAIDKPEKVAQFVAELGIDFPIMIGQSDAYDIMKDLGNEALTLPYTILIDNKDEVIWSKNTELKHSDMDEVLNIE
tara:strand:- start:632 stop:1126 length:495 start_codon:yes stop_codon:yes gene_type:complete